MKVVAKILLYLLGVVLLSSLVAPPLYRLGRAVVDAGILPQLAPFGFPKYFNRAFLVVGVASLWPFLRWLGLSRWTELGLEPNPGRFRDLGLGFAIGSIGLWCVAAGLMLSGQAAFDDRSVPWLGLLVVVATATVVPLIEEPFFRGALLGLLRRALPWRAALVFLSFLFAVMHFVKPQPGSPPIDDVRWHSGFELFTRVFWQFGRPDLVVGGWLSLFLVGLTLGYSVVRTRSLYMALGLHCGWVLALRSFNKLTHRTAPSSIWVGQDITTGIVPVALLVATLVLVHFLLRRRADTAGALVPDPAADGGERRS